MRWKWIVGVSISLIIALIVMVYVVLNTYDYNKLKPRVARMVKDATGRELHLGGEINLAIGFSPSLEMTDVAIANASWGSQPQMIEIEKLKAQVRLLPLLFKEVKVNQIGLFGVKVLLETGPDARRNWDLFADNGSVESTGTFKPTAIDVDQVNIDNLHFTFLSRKTGTKTQFALVSMAMNRQETEDVLMLNLRADYNGQPLTLSGKTGRVRQIFAHQHFPFQLSGSLANAEVKIQGAIDDVMNLQGIGLEARLTGKNLATFGPFLDIKLPETKTFSVTGNLKGSKDSLKLENIIGNLSGSGVDVTVSGSVGNLIAFRSLDLKLKSSGKDLAVLTPVIGEKLPATDQFEIQGRLTGSTETLTLQEAQGSARRGSMSLTVKGKVDDLLTLEGMDLQSRLTGKDLAEFGVVIEEKLPATDQFEVQGRLIGSTAALALQQAQGSAVRDSMRLSLNGSVKDLLTLKGMDLQSRLTGKELSEMGPLMGANLPDLGPFDVSAQISGTANSLSINKFEAILEKSDFKGLVKVEILKRPKIAARLESSVIDFTALMKSLEKDEHESVDKKKQKHLLFNDDPLPFNILKKVDADILLKARNIYAKDAHLEFGHLVLKLEEHDFSIDKLEATYKETKISGNIQIDAGAPSQVSTRFLVQDFNLGDFLKETGRNDQVRAIIDIAAYGKSSGNSVHSLMANLDGAIGVVMGKGYLTKYLDMLSSGLTQKVFQIWKPHKEVDQIECAVVQFDIKAGVAKSKAFVFDTQAGVLAGEGKINLGSEKINFLLVPKPAHPDLSILTNLRVSGSIMDPHVGVDKTSALTQGASALSALVAGPLGLLAPFVHLGAHKAHPCDVPSIGQLGIKTPDSQ